MRLSFLTHHELQKYYAVKNRAKHFYVPTGVAQYLIKWGVSPSKISEHNWWDEITFDNIKLVVPAFLWTWYDR